jgi:hypothetical protein
MALNYTNALAYTRLLLMESGTAIWADGDIQGAIRLALGEMGLYSGEPFTLNGLDGALVTTIPGVLESALVVGAAGYAAAARGEDRAEAFELANESKSSLTFSAERLKEYRGMLEKVYPNGYARQKGFTSAVPGTDGAYGKWKDDFGERER